jgi:predicted metal-dependent HD superfamily phosphohydrolase
MAANVERLRHQWRQLIAPFNSDAGVANAVFDDLVASYSTAGRFYHTSSHLEHLLEIISRLADQAGDVRAVRLAAWFHDVVYDSRANDNEERSAEVALNALSRLNVPDELASRVAGLIIATKTHEAPPGDSDAATLLDADLAILGAPPAEYALYAEAIRREYSWVPEQDYRAGRRQVLKRFLARRRIFLTDSMFRSSESEARRNLSEEIVRLQ